MKILVTAFEPFGTIKTNSSLEVVNKIISKHELKKVILPVKLNTSYEILQQEIMKFNPEIIILCGQAASRKVISIETTARNLITKKVSLEDEVDLNNSSIIENNSSIIENNTTSYYSKFLVEEALSRLVSLNIPAELSADAGEYICNALYFKTMHYHQNIPSVFIHFPLFKGQIEDENLNSNIELDVLIKGLEEIINML